MIDENYIDDGGLPEATVNEEREFIHSRLLCCTLECTRDTMVLVSSSRGTIYKRKLGSK